MDLKRNDDAFPHSAPEQPISPHKSAAQRKIRRERALARVCSMAFLALLLGSPGVEASVHKRDASAAHRVTVTAYTNTSRSRSCISGRTASSLRIRSTHYWKLIALSPDLAKGYRFGDRFILRVNGREYPVEYQDVMAKRHKRKIDFLLPSVKQCRRFGVKGGVLVPEKDSAHRTANRPGRFRPSS